MLISHPDLHRFSDETFKANFAISFGQFVSIITTYRHASQLCNTNETN